MIRPLFQEFQDTYVGLKSIVNQDWGMYPNPSNGEITLTLPENQTNIELFVYDVSGRIVFNVNELSSQITIDIKKNLSAGVYFIEMRNKEGKLGNIKQLILN